MSFVSLEFFILLSTTLILVMVFKQQTLRKFILLTASCAFYAYWDWRFLGLLGTVTILDYFISRLMTSSENFRYRRLLLVLSIITNLGFLAWFKYFDFFINSLNTVFSPFGFRLGTLEIILPIGISFYTFETLSYVIDIYRRQTSPAKSLIDYAIFITFFPRLVAGPIMRARQFLPQLETGIQVNSANIIRGSQFFLMGLIKKLVIADNLSVFVDQVYHAPSLFNSPTVVLAVFAYSIQILCDFSGYTDMAKGIGAMLGIELPDNFHLPYTSQSITEFWQRWHISLSTWLRDYLYIPLGGNRKGNLRTYLNLMITMLLGGLWHGASWNFVLWGGLHGCYLLLERLFVKVPQTIPWNRVSAWLRSAWTFTLVSFAWVLFRSPTTQTTLEIFRKIVSPSGDGVQWIFTPALYTLSFVILGGCILRGVNFTWQPFPASKAYTLPFILLASLVVFFLSSIKVSPFIYFQF